MTFEETIEFLEPTDSRGGALCMSVSDWTAIKTSLEQACVKQRCSYEKDIINKIELLMERAHEKAIQKN